MGERAAEPRRAAAQPTHGTQSCTLPPAAPHPRQDRTWGGTAARCLMRRSGGIHRSLAAPRLNHVSCSVSGGGRSMRLSAAAVAAAACAAFQAGRLGVHSSQQLSCSLPPHLGQHGVAQGLLLRRLVRRLRHGPALGDAPVGVAGLALRSPPRRVLHLCGVAASGQ